MDHRQPVQPEQAVELGQHPIDFGRVADVVAGAPKMGGIEAEGDPPVETSRAGALEHRSQLLDADADSVAAARRVLDDRERSVWSVRQFGQSPRQTIDQPGHAGLNARAAM